MNYAKHLTKNASQQGNHSISRGKVSDNEERTCGEEPVTEGARQLRSNLMAGRVVGNEPGSLFFKMKETQLSP